LGLESGPAEGYPCRARKKCHPQFKIQPSPTS
jgi:hypothetical protein